MTMARNVRFPTELKHAQHLMRGGTRCVGNSSRGCAGERADQGMSEFIYGYHLVPPERVHSTSYRLFAAYLPVHMWEHSQLQWSRGQCRRSNSTGDDTAEVEGVCEDSPETETETRPGSLEAQLQGLWNEFYDFELSAVAHLNTTTWGTYIERCSKGPAGACGDVTTTPEYAHLAEMYKSYTEDRAKVNVIIYFHGNGATRAADDRIALVKSLAGRHGAHVVAFDYSYFGDSDASERSFEHPDELSTFVDARAVLEWVLRKTGKCSAGSREVSVFLYGHSLGTGVTIDYLYQLVAHQQQQQLRVRGDWLTPLMGAEGGLLAQDVSPFANTCNSYSAYADGFGTTSTRTSASVTALGRSLVTGLILDSPFSSLPAGALDHPLGAVFRLLPVFKALV